MSKHDGLLDTKLVQGVLIERGMRSGRPQPARALAVAVAGPLDDNHAVALGEPVHQAVHGEVLDQSAVAVNEGQGLAGPFLNVVQAHPVHVQKAPDRRVFALSVSRLLGRIERSSA